MKFPHAIPITEIAAEYDAEIIGDKTIEVTGINEIHKVEKGEKLATLEAMKMQTSLYAPAPGTIAEICVAVGESVDSKDLLLRLE